jgi:hypothetical protein
LPAQSLEEFQMVPHALASDVTPMDRQRDVFISHSQTLFEFEALIEFGSQK